MSPASPLGTTLAELRERISRIEQPGAARHGVLPFGVAAIDQALPGGGLALGAVHEILGQGGDEEDGAAPAGFIVGILARIGGQGLRPTSERQVPPPQPSSASGGGSEHPGLTPSPACGGGLGWGHRNRPDARLDARLYLVHKDAQPNVAGSFETPATRAPQDEDGSQCNPTTDLILRSGPGDGQGRVSKDARACSPYHAAGTLGHGPVLWCLKRDDLYGPGLAEHGLAPARLTIVRAGRDEDLLWALEEGLRTPGLAAVVGEIGVLPMVAGRRLQLAAEQSGISVFLVRRWRNTAEAAAERARPSAALTRWRITALPSVSYPSPRRLPLTPTLSPLAGRGRKPWVGEPRWRVELLRCRGGVPAAWEVEAADETGHVSLSPGLADRPIAPSWPGAELAERRRLG